MGKSAIMRSGILNIRAHPHSAEIYANLIGVMFSLKRAIKLRGDRYGVISLLEHEPDDDGMIRGILTTFINIDLNSEWFDLENLQEASGEKVSEISIPQNLFPNPSSFYFYFNVKTHRIYVQTYSKGRVFAIRDAERFFQSLSLDKEIKARFGDIKVTMVQGTESLEKIFDLVSISKVRIVIEKPNSDIFDEDFEQKIEKHLEESNSRQIEIIYSSERGESIAVTDDIRRVGESALDNGLVEVTGRSATGRERRSTRSHPRIVQEEYEIDLATEAQALRALALSQP